MIDLNGLYLVFFHVLAVIAALGGSLFLMFVLFPVAQTSLDEKQYLKFMAQVIKRFHPWLLACYGALILTGAWIITRYKIDAGVNFFNEYGKLLAIKLALVFLLVLVSSYQFFGIGTQIVYLVEGENADPVAHAGEIKAYLQRLRLTSWISLGLFLVIIYLGLAISRA